MVDESFVPATQQTNILYCRLTDFIKTLSIFCLPKFTQVEELISEQLRQVLVVQGLWNRLLHPDEKYICPCPQIGFNAHSENLLLWDTISTRHVIVSCVLSYVGLVLRDILSEAEIVILKEIPRSWRIV